MALVYFAGPVDLDSDPTEGATAAIDELVAAGHVVYNATRALNCDPRALSKTEAQAVLQHHRDILDVADGVIVDLSRRSIGVPIEMYIAWMRGEKHPTEAIPIVAYLPEDDKPSLYVKAIVTGHSADWQTVGKTMANVLYVKKQSQLQRAARPNIGQSIINPAPYGRLDPEPHH